MFLEIYFFSLGENVFPNLHESLRKSLLSEYYNNIDFT